MRNQGLLNGFLTALLATAVLPGAGCGGSDDPVNVAGTYALSIVNGVNGCMFDDWNSGDTAQASITVTQDTSDPRKVTVRVDDLLGLFVAAVLGSQNFVGEVEGRTINARLVGREATIGACTETLNADFVGALSGDALTGNLRYSFQTNGNAACGGHLDCVNTQNFNGTRPPQAM
jgi:hypothetical protein